LPNSKRHPTTDAEYQTIISRHNAVLAELVTEPAVRTTGCVDTLLRHVADYVIANVLVADTGLRWLYHPYDGGMDVLLPTTLKRDALRDRHLDWLSMRPDGL
jgi:hypothetical protein